MFDDGSGPALYVGGEFENRAFPGRQGIAKWNGTEFVAVGGAAGGLDGPVWAMTVFDDDGPGPHAPALYVGGTFALAGGTAVASVAKWDGAAWSDVGGGVQGTVYAIKGHDDGMGPALYVGGDFYQAGVVNAGSIARYRNGEWQEVGEGGVTLGTFGGYVQTMESYGGALYVGGFFEHAGGVFTNALAKWNGSGFETLAGGVSYGGSTAQVESLLAVNLPSTGNVLVVVGTMDGAGGAPAGSVMRWNGTEWLGMNAGNFTWSGSCLAVHDDGTGPALYLGGVVPAGSGVSKWNGTSWDLVGAIPTMTGVPLGLDTMTSMPGRRLFLGGMYNTVDGVPVPWSSVLQGGHWSPFGPFGLGFDGPVNALKVLDLGDGARMYAAGSFKISGGVPAAGVARLGPSGWEPLATSMSPSFSTIRTMEVYDSGNGPALYVGGSFDGINGVPAANVAKWRPGTGWSATAAGLSSFTTSVFGTVYALATHQEPGSPRPALFATGIFQFTGTTPVTNVARWNGTAWSSVGAGAGPDGTGGACLASLDLDGPGGQPAKLYFGGVFLPVASWNGTTWTNEPETLNTSVVSSVGAFDFGDGRTLFAGGDVVGPFNGSLAKRRGAGWEDVGISPRFPFGGWSGGSADHGSVMSTLSFTDTFGTGLYMTGIFGDLRSEGYRNIARWTGTRWVGLGGGLASRFPGPDGRGAALAAFNDGSGMAIFAAGKFERFYNATSDTLWHATYNIAKWVPCLPPPACPAEFNNDGTLNADDLGDFITCYFSTPPCAGADFNHADGVNADDLGDYITAYFTGC